MPLRTRTRRVLLAVAATPLLLVAAVFLWAWRSPPFYTEAPPAVLPVPVLTMDEYDAVSQTHPRPYVVEAETSEGGGAVLLFGAEHTRDPDDPQLAALRSLWDRFAPTVCLVEGRLGFLLPGLMDPAAHYGEMGAAAALARRDGLPIYSWEPPREAEVARMLEAFPAERVALFYVLRPYVSGLRHGKPEDPEGYVEAYRRERTAWPGLEGTIPSVAALDRLWQRDFAGFPDWRDTSDAYGWPGYLAALSDRSNALRDEHLAAVILDLVRRGERVFAVAGSSHAVKLDGALHGALGG
jgi:hypothetical protein